MSILPGEKELKKCLQACISIIEDKTKQHARADKENDGRESGKESAVHYHDTDILSFTIDQNEHEFMEDIKAELENVFPNHLVSLPGITRIYLKNVLYENNYDYDKRAFNSAFNRGTLFSFLNDLKEMLASPDAYRAAWSGEQTMVADYLQKFPRAKNKTGPWGTTILFSAARNNHLKLVKYLVQKLRCSVNAQNRQHIKRALAKPITIDDDFQRDPSSGSTALHGACYFGHLDMIKFLMNMGADYFIRNHADETPLTNALNSVFVDQDQKQKILEYFRNFLILGYSSITSTLPSEPISEGSDSYITDSVWEYKPFADLQWYPFSITESTNLQQALIVKPDQSFKREIHLLVRGGTYSVSLIEFLRSGRDRATDKSLAWVRCRGSPIANFQCYGLWQMMLQQHPSAENDFSMKMFDIPTIYDSHFELKLNTWYFCDAKTNNQLDYCMNRRRRYIEIDISVFSNDDLVFDLLAFTFTNRTKSISGYIRWIPKMISSNAWDKGEIIGISDFRTLTNSDPIPLTTSIMKHSSVMKDNSLNEEETEYDNEWQEDDPSADDSIVPKMKDRTTEPSENSAFSINDVISGSGLSENNPDYISSLLTTISEDVDDKTEESSDQFINAEAGQCHPTEQILLTETTVSSDDGKQETALSEELLTKQQKVEELEQEKRTLEIKVQELMIRSSTQSVEYESELAKMLNKNDLLLEEIKSKKQEELHLQQTISSLKFIEYKNIERSVVLNVLVPNHAMIINMMKESQENSKKDSRIPDPRIEFQNTEEKIIIKVISFQTQQENFRSILNRILSFLKIIQAAKDYYERHLKRINRLLRINTLSKVKFRTANWTEYKKIFSQLMEEKLNEFKKAFDDFMDEYSKKRMENCISGQLYQPWIQIRDETDDYVRKTRLEDEIEPIKRKALDSFIEQNVFLQRAKLDMRLSVKSVHVLQQYIDKVRAVFTNDPSYRGHTTEHFQMIPKLLERIMLYYASFKIQLPLYETSEDLLDKVEKHAITTISTSTGSGKSTLLPALLIAEGYDKVIVTQPRRLPCQLICTRVNQTMTSEVKPSGEALAGWAVSGADKNPQAKVLYLTDGLLKQRLLKDPHLITEHTKLNRSVVFFIDEVHERSVNIDLCLGLLARLLTIRPALKLKMKVIISSATLDSSVPRLFQNIPHASLAQFKMPQMGTLHHVDKFPRPNENVLDIVQELCKKRKRNEQILCFVSSVAEVNRSTKLIEEISRGTIIAHPLIQSQHPNIQQQNIEHGTVFFSTTIAETSLTFPCLKYVIDTGMINTPVYDPESKRTVLKEVRAAESTIKQRLGRLGRTQPGEYYFVYDFQVREVQFPIPHICQSDLMNIEFSLRKSLLGQGFQYFKEFLADKPSDLAINKTIEELIELNILNKKDPTKLTMHGEALAKLPDFGSLAMSKAVLAALRDYDCGYDLICLSSILGVLNTTQLFQSVPQSLKSSDGDFMTLFNIMNEILLLRQSCPPHQFDLDAICQAKGLQKIQHIIRQALRRYTKLEEEFLKCEDFRARSQIKSGKWEYIARSLLAGYSDNVFVSMKELRSRIHYFLRYNGKGEVALLDLQSTLTRPISQAPVAIILARDIRHSTAIREKAVLSFAGEIKAEWAERHVKREMKLNANEMRRLKDGNVFQNIMSKFMGRVNLIFLSSPVLLSGPAGLVLETELHLRQQMIHNHKFLLGPLPGKTPHQNFQRNLQSIIKMPKIFNPLIWRWQAQRQVDISVNADTSNSTCEITVNGTDSDFDDVKKEFDAFIGWLQECAVIRHPNAGASPRVLRPQTRKDCKDIEERIAHVTDPKRTPIDLHKGIKGGKSSRETRMEVVAWIAVCKFDCKIEGGFVRDWIVGHYIARPSSTTKNPRAWIKYIGSIPYLDKEVVPCDLDCHLPSHAYFDIEKFQDELFKYDISATVIREDWRYVLLLDANAVTGPFTMDLIEPHVALTHDRIDFDVNNLYVEKDLTHELGMRIDIGRAPHNIELENIVENIKKKRFQVLRQVDNRLTPRIDKMIKSRGWTKIDPDLSVIPEPHFKRNALLVPLPKSSSLFKDISNRMQVLGSVTIDSIEEIRNPSLEETYLGMKKLIKKQCPNENPNEQELFHGTKDVGVNGIVEDGFDDRYVKGGLYGHGAYFADDPKKSHGYTDVLPGGNTRVMFYNKVLLGVQHQLTQPDKTLKCAPKGFHSVVGKHNNQTEYIVYRYGQALPYLKIVYRV